MDNDNNENKLDARIELLSLPNASKLPHAVSALIVNESGFVLGVSRKYDQNDFGLPGGKLDPGEGTLEALVREVREETGLDVVKAYPFFGAPCGNPALHKVHWCITYLCKVEGYVHTTEKGRVAWIPPERLLADEAGKKSSFSDYNRAVLAIFKEFEALKVDPKPYLSSIEIPESLILRWSWDDSGKHTAP